jgi:multidrug transporter EmrE-like cation transporter
MGFLLAYRAGWNISLAQFYATTILTLLLIPIGLCFFQEKITMINVFGIILCLGGVILLNHK